MPYSVKVERFHSLKDLYQNFDTEEEAREFLDYLMDCMNENGTVKMAFRYRGDTTRDVVEETHVFRADVIKAIQMVATYSRGD